MDGKKQELTPEEKLLALIQQGKQPDKPAAPVAAPAPVPAAPAPPPATPVAAAAVPVSSRPSAVTAPVASPVPPPQRPAAQPVAAQPVAAQPVAAQPVAAQPDAAQPVAAQPVAAQPVAAQPVAAQPVAAQPVAAATPAKPATPPAEKKVKLASETPRPPASAEPVKSAPPAPVPHAEPDKPAGGEVAPAPVPLPVSEPAPASRPPFRPISGSRIGGLALVNRSLAVVVLVLVILVVYSIASIRSEVAAEVQRQKNGAGEMPMGTFVATNEPLPTLESFLDKASRRDLFALAGAGGGPAPTNAVPVKVEKSADLKLMGVSLDSAEPGESIAIIKNKPDSKTFFVKVGQAVGETGYTLQRVMPDRVVLKSKKQELELK
jgi:hypothetical protein